MSGKSRGLVALPWVDTEVDPYGRHRLVRADSMSAHEWGPTVFIMIRSCAGTGYSRRPPRSQSDRSTPSDVSTRMQVLSDSRQGQLFEVSLLYPSSLLWYLSR